MRALVIAAHPDDEVLGCGGTIARLIENGEDVYVAILGEGITSRYASPKDADPALVRKLHDDCMKAAGALGLEHVTVGDLPDNRFDTVPLLDIAKRIEEILKKTRPETVFTHHGGDLNIDHVLTHRATLTACRPVSGNCVRDICAYEVPSSTEWSAGVFEPRFVPTVYFDISTTLDRKLKALQCYSTETAVFPHPRSIDSVRVMAQDRGRAVGLQAAEAFQLIRGIR